jgi:hypothetical protein
MFMPLVCRTSLSCGILSCQPCVSAIERGKLGTVTLSTLRAYVRALAGSCALSRTSAARNTG